MATSSKEKRWDVFISHASEDRAAVAIPITSELRRAGLTVWLDAHELTLGDSLRSKIDEGLGHSRFGVVILSNAFFAKHWPQLELNALVALESNNRKVLLPVLHGINHHQVASYSPTLADKLSTSTDRGVQHVALEITKAVRHMERSAIDRETSLPPTSDHSLLRPEELVGTTINSYKLEKHLGSGGSGVVFRASHRDLGNQLAIKIFYPLAPEYVHFNGLFENGFRALSRLKHPSIISTKDFGSTNFGGVTTYYLVMDFVAGQTLNRWNRTLGEDKGALNIRLQVAQQLATAMAAAHETIYTDQLGFEVHGVLHGDLKPANVIVGSDGFPAILDFLLVDVQRLLDPRVIPTLRAFDRDRMRQITAAFGTSGFMAPEQAEHGVVTISTDIYGFGVTLCYLFLPNHNSPTISVKRDTKLPRFIKDLLIEMTAFEPHDRPESMREVVQRLGLKPQTGWFEMWASKLVRKIKGRST